tara:strand:+ start:1282 stop:1554 length:273 start_codon:yes stop_codon:yes gene_type:complete
MAEEGSPMISGTRLKEWRKAARTGKPKGLSRTELAFLVNVSVDTIHRAEQQGRWPITEELESVVSSGKTIRLTRMETVIHELKCDLSPQE